MLFEHFTVTPFPNCFLRERSLANWINKDFCIAESRAAQDAGKQVSLYIIYLERKSGAAQAAPASPTPTAMPSASSDSDNRGFG